MTYKKLSDEDIRARIEQYRSDFPYIEPKINHDIRVGDLRRLAFGDLRYRVAFGAGDPRLVVVRKVLDTHAVVVLVHAYTEMATSADAVFEREESYPLVVQKDIIGCARHEQIDTLLDRLPDEWEDEAWSGAPLLGPLDCRWTFKAREGEALRALTLETWLDLTK